MIKAIYKGKENIKLIEEEMPKCGDNDIIVKKHLFKHLRHRCCGI